MVCQTTPSLWGEVRSGPAKVVLSVCHFLKQAKKIAFSPLKADVRHPFLDYGRTHRCRKGQ
ncbi:hypothetical protein PANT111_100067 [Pantoea brenneri]|uniref:Uncharacterized protein n=1 Tax=Pantoea brenneri TaxID=472694 RepID=A0AAX3J0Q6_9GAMM|nr:hypothetical protein PANT111_100067 [Pantoea brenneri]